jgi:hypothetical protein
MSLDGFIAGPNGRPGNPLGDGGTRIHQWLYPLATFHELTVHLAPVVVSQGVRLFDQATIADGTLQSTKVVGSPSVTHLSFRVVKEGAAR